MHSPDDKDIDDSSQKLRQTLDDLKKVKHLQEQTEKMNKINQLLNKIHGKSDDNHAVSMQKIAFAQKNMMVILRKSIILMVKINYYIL